MRVCEQAIQLRPDSLCSLNAVDAHVDAHGLPDARHSSSVESWVAVSHSLQIAGRLTI
jgi:hypothetical protein